MTLPVVMAQGDLPTEVAEAVPALIGRKVVTRDMGPASAPAGLTAFIREVRGRKRVESAEPPVLRRRHG